MQQAPHSAPKAMALLAMLALAALFLLTTPSPTHAERATLLVPDRASVEPSMDNTQWDGAVNNVSATGNGVVSERQAKGNVEAKGSEKTTAKADATADKTGRPAKNGKVAAREDKASKEPQEPTWGLDEVCTLVDNVSATLTASLAPQELKEEANLLIVGMEPSRHQAIPMDLPRILSIYRFDEDSEKADTPVVREDRLDDIEEIRYLDQKAWGANVGLELPGLYQFVIETQPWWSTENACFAQHLVKTMLPVHGKSAGWEAPLGLAFEIVPTTRPFGLFSPALFSGTVLVNGKPEKGLKVRVFRVNTENQAAPTPWHEEMVALTGENGTFSVVLNRPGWWCCMATREGAPLKAPNGQLSPLKSSTLFWLYVDAAEK